MQVKSTRTTKKARIEIIPLIDVIMFLLATFVLFTLSMTKTMNIPMKLPEGTTKPDPNAPKPYKIGVDTNGAFFWNQEQITWDDLLIKLSTLKQIEADPIVLIEGERTAEFGNAVKVLDEARKARIEKVSIDTKAKESVR